MVKPMIASLHRFMDKHGFQTVEDFRGKSLEYFTTHAELSRRQREAQVKKALEKDSDWNGDKFVEQTDNLVTATTV
jgi:dihydropyrimidine dehydrogenase (NADP+)